MLHNVIAILSGVMCYITSYNKHPYTPNDSEGTVIVSGQRFQDCETLWSDIFTSHHTTPSDTSIISQPFFLPSIVQTVEESYEQHSVQYSSLHLV